MKTDPLLQQLARMGAQRRLEEIEVERRTLQRMFPDLAPAADVDARRKRMLAHMRKMRAAKKRKDAQ